MRVCAVWNQKQPQNHYFHLRLQMLLFLLYIVIIIIFLAGVETHCDSRHDGAHCYRALGGTVDIRLMNSTSEIFRFQLSKNQSSILTVRNKTIATSFIHGKSLFIPSNGTYRINNLSRTDSGNYSFETFDSDGRSTVKHTFHLFIQGKCFLE